MNLDGIRSETPGVLPVVHLNNAGAPLMPAPVVQIMHDYLDMEARTGGGRDQYQHSNAGFYATGLTGPRPPIFTEASPQLFQF